MVQARRSVKRARHTKDRRQVSAWLENAAPPVGELFGLCQSRECDLLITVLGWSSCDIR